MELSHSNVVRRVFPANLESVVLTGPRAWKVAPALAVGCTIVMKPSEITPLTALVSRSEGATITDSFLIRFHFRNFLNSSKRLGMAFLHLF